MEGRGGRTPRPRTPRRLYRDMSAATHTPPGAPGLESLSRRRRTYIQVYPLHHSPRFLECPCHPTPPTLSRAMDRAVAHIGIGPESLWTCYMGSLAGRAGHTPRRTSIEGQYRGLRAGTDSLLAAPGLESLSRRRRTYIRVYPLHHSPRFLKCPRRGQRLRSRERWIEHVHT